jgi:H+/Cl- antiporter ClcA
VTPPVDPLATLRSRRYVGLLALAAVIGAPVSALAYFFLWLVNHLQEWIFTTIPADLGFHGEPVWWPLIPVPLAGLLVALSLRYLPGSGGHEPADGFKAGGVPPPVEIPGVFTAAIATLALGVVLGPEAPLIALGGGVATLVVYAARRDAPTQTVAVVAAAGSFAAISALLGSPLLGAFLLMEAIGLGGPMATLVLLPGLLASGIGFLVFLGLDSLTGLGTFSLTLPNLPTFIRPNGAEFAWGLLIGVVAGCLGPLIQHTARRVRTGVGGHRMAAMPALGLAVAGLAILYVEVTGKPLSDVLFSGQDNLPTLVAHAGAYGLGALVLLVACKGLAYALSMSSFRGGPVFPAIFIGGALGIACSHLPGMSLVPGLAMGIGALSAAVLQFPFTGVLLASVLLGSDGLAAMPLAIVAVVVAYVVSLHLANWLVAREASPAGSTAPTATDHRVAQPASGDPPPPGTPGPPPPGR